jgi:hypothetical protein
MASKKGITDRAIDSLEENGYLSNVRAEMKAEVIKALVELEEAGEIPPSLRISRYTPVDTANKEALGYVLEFLKFHKLDKAAACLANEVNGEIPEVGNSADSSLIAQKVTTQEEADQEDTS